MARYSVRKHGIEVESFEEVDEARNKVIEGKSAAPPRLHFGWEIVDTETGDAVEVAD